jgi:N,N'-diacetyllegionaminate synthase
MFGPDVPASLTTEELRQLVEGVRFIEKMKDNPIDKDAMASSLSPLRDLFTKSIVVRRDLGIGTVLTEADLTYKKPGTGIPANQTNIMIGRRLRRAVQANQRLSLEDLE